MKRTAFIIALGVMLALCGCGNSSRSSGESTAVATGNGPFATLAEKYAAIAENSQAFDNEMAEISREDGDWEKKANAAADEMKEKNDKLAAEAKVAGERLTGQKIQCEASEATSLTGIEAKVATVKTSSRRADIFLTFTDPSKKAGNFACLFKNDKGEVVKKLTTYDNGDGTMSVILTIGTSKGPENAIEASEISNIEIMTADEAKAAETPDA